MIAIVVCAVLILAWLGLYGWLTARRRTAPYAPRHGHVPFADPADRSDPDGAGYVGQLLDPPAGEPDGANEPDWWDEPAPPPAVEILTGPDRRIAQTAQLTTSVLSRVREGLLSVEPDGTTATFTPAPGVTMPVSDDPDTTGVQRHAAAIWGKTAPELADELEAEHFGARYLT
jgi:hypothetical protein